MPTKKATSVRSEQRAGKILPILRIGSVMLGGKSPLFILGPCVIEGEKPLLRAARTIKTICDDLGAQFIFKASYDKANRTSGSSYRGVGALDGLAELHLIADQYDIRGAGRHAGEVGDGNLPGLINEKIIQLALGGGV